MKLCPMKFNANQDVVSEDYLCEEDSCAWWNEHENKCIIHTLHHIANGVWNA